MFRWLRRRARWTPEAACSRIRAGNPPARMRVDGALNLARSTVLRALPGTLRATTIDLSDCISLVSLPDDLACEELLVRRTNVVMLPLNLRVSKHISARDCRRLRLIPPLAVDRLNLSGCTSLGRVPEGLAARTLVLSGCTQLTGVPASIAQHVEHLDLSNCSSLAKLPENFVRLHTLNVSGCTRLETLPEGLRVRSWVDVAGSALRSLPWSLRSASVRWRGAPVSDRVAFDDSDDFTADEIFAESNLTYRRILLERVGLDRLVEHARANTVDRDQDRGGERKLLRIEFDGGEDIVCVLVRCPSTGSRYVLRVPPETRTCREAIAWTAGFANADAYRPDGET